LTTEPISLPVNLIESLDLVIFIKRVREKVGRYIRRISSLVEIAGFDREKENPITQDLCKWNPKNDEFDIIADSYLLKKVADTHGMGYDVVQEDIKKRAKVLRWMVEKNIRDYKKVAAVINLFYTAPDYLLQRIDAEI
jgi:flagellar protein FlaI